MEIESCLLTGGGAALEQFAQMMPGPRIISDSQLSAEIKPTPSGELAINQNQFTANQQHHQRRITTG